MYLPLSPTHETLMCIDTQKKEKKEMTIFLYSQTMTKKEIIY